MHGLPVQRDTLLTVAAAALLPFLPTAAIEVPLKDILARLIGMLICRNASEVCVQTVRAEPFGGAQGERNADFS
jgi:hypothetical protein